MNIVNPSRICPECGAAFTAHHGRQTFCSTAHQTKFHDVMARRGKVMMPLALSWRSGRNIGKTNAKRKGHAAYAFGEMCKLLDQWAEVDRIAGRDPSLITAGKADASWSAVDIGPAEKARRERAAADRDAAALIG